MNLEEKPFPLLIVGAGRLGSAWIEALAPELPGAGPIRIAGVADPDPARSGAALALEEVEVLPDPLRAARLTEPEGVILCTPPGTHGELTQLFLDLGLPILCAPPLAPTPAEAAAMLDQARELDLALCLGSRFRFVPDLQRAAELLESRILGDPITADLEFAGRFNATGTWHAAPPEAGGGVLADLGPGALEVARMLLGPVAEIQARKAPQIQEIDPEDTVHLILEHQQGAMTRIFLTWSLPATSPWLAQVRGSQGTLQVGREGSRYKMHDAPDWVPCGSGWEERQILAEMAAAFARAVRGEEEYPVSDEAALATVELVAAAQA